MSPSGGKPACRVVVVDDSSLIRQRLLGMLSQSADVEVVGEADSASRALTLIRALEPDAVTLDLMMPDGNGLEVLEQIRRLPFSPKVVVLTNYPYPAFRRRCMELGADFFLNKSTEFQRIPAILSSNGAGKSE